MTRLRHFAVLSLELFLCLAFVDQGLANVTVHNVRYTQDLSTAPFDGSFAEGTGAAIRFHINHQADSVVVGINNPGFGTVRTLRKVNLAAGDNFDNWNGSASMMEKCVVCSALQFRSSLPVHRPLPYLRVVAYK